MHLFLLVAGCLFPLISWLTLLLSYIVARGGRSSSGIYIPFVGPALLSIWLVRVDAPHWTLPLPWIADIGTVFFLVWLPRLAREIWQTSRFTRLYKLTGSDGNESVVISFHRGGNYLLQKHWYRPAGEPGMIAIGEPGTFSSQQGIVSLCSHTGRQRYLVPEGAVHAVTDAGESDELQLQGWRLLKTTG
ncbi:hypothetical protein CR152_06680 [Massilia violaceinigra]|uniref:Uncharacterized protein n=1 Tax=Massilia violaceinigra TaxID=2045208 RepID=A0A2D2DGW8_9BURK|nr:MULTISPECIES: hypothetical protein [Massilia]ATQ74220.1 hypothetical protein CR152_06680 [Massilia violaceinigra]MDQ1813868.1 hypothetical protein [Massilia sp. CCM 9210]